jgi:hypothetical protein
LTKIFITLARLAAAGYSCFVQEKARHASLDGAARDINIFRNGAAWSSARRENTMNDYEVVTARRVADLQDRVRELMKKGLRPLGGVAMLHEEESGDGKLHMVFAQAVVRDGAGHDAWVTNCAPERLKGQG